MRYGLKGLAGIVLGISLAFGSSNGYGQIPNLDDTELPTRTADICYVKPGEKTDPEPDCEMNPMGLGLIVKKYFDPETYVNTIKERKGLRAWAKYNVLNRRLRNEEGTFLKEFPIYPFCVNLYFDEKAYSDLLGKKIRKFEDFVKETQNMPIKIQSTVLLGSGGTRLDKIVTGIEKEDLMKSYEDSMKLIQVFSHKGESIFSDRDRRLLTIALDSNLRDIHTGTNITLVAGVKRPKIVYKYINVKGEMVREERIFHELYAEPLNDFIRLGLLIPDDEKSDGKFDGKVGVINWKAIEDSSALGRLFKHKYKRDLRELRDSK